MRSTGTAPSSSRSTTSPRRTTSRFGRCWPSLSSCCSTATSQRRCQKNTFHVGRIRRCERTTVLHDLLLPKVNFCLTLQSERQDANETAILVYNFKRGCTRVFLPQTKQIHWWSLVNACQQLVLTSCNDRSNRGAFGLQGSLVEYFLGTREEKFFFAVKNRMNLSAIATKEK